ncbi:hypothetical protein KIPB_004269, partial [Kipferlia bialata]|eukprot:g4269.t1
MSGASPISSTSGRSLPLRFQNAWPSVARERQQTREVHASFAQTRSPPAAQASRGYESSKPRYNAASVPLTPTFPSVTSGILDLPTPSRGRQEGGYSPQLASPQMIMGRSTAVKEGKEQGVAHPRTGSRHGLTATISSGKDVSQVSSPMPIRHTRGMEMSTLDVPISETLHSMWGKTPAQTQDTPLDRTQLGRSGLPPMGVAPSTPSSAQGTGAGDLATRVNAETSIRLRDQQITALLQKNTELSRAALQPSTDPAV